MKLRLATITPVLLALPLRNVQALVKCIHNPSTKDCHLHPISLRRHVQKGPVVYWLEALRFASLALMPKCHSLLFGLFFFLPQTSPLTTLPR